MASTKLNINLSKIPKKYVYTDQKGNQWINVVAWDNGEPNEWGKDWSVSLDITTEQKQKEFNGKSHYVGSGKTLGQQKASSGSDSLDF